MVLKSKPLILFCCNFGTIRGPVRFLNLDTSQKVKERTFIRCCGCQEIFVLLQQKSQWSSSYSVWITEFRGRKDLLGYIVHHLATAKWLSTIIFSSTLCYLVLNISANNRILTTSLGKLLKGLFKTKMGYFSSYFSCVDRQMDEYRYIWKNKILWTDLFRGRWIEKFRNVFHSSVICTQVP